MLGCYWQYEKFTKFDLYQEKHGTQTQSVAENAYNVVHSELYEELPYNSCYKDTIFQSETIILLLYQLY